MLLPQPSFERETTEKIDLAVLEREITSTVDNVITKKSGDPVSPGIRRWRKIQASLSELTRTKYSLQEPDEGKDGESLPYDAIIHFTNSDAVLDLFNPWKVNSPRVSTGTGFYIGDKRILTNCHVVKDTTSLRVFKHGCPGNFAARVLCASAICDLALVTVDDESFFAGLRAISFQQRVPDLDEEVCAVGYPLGAKSVTN